jgi:hypothetical protein
MTIVIGYKGQVKDSEVSQSSTQQQPDQKTLTKRETLRAYNRERRRQSQKAWYQQNRERGLVKRRTYNQTHREQENAKQRLAYKRKVDRKLKALIDGLEA